MSNTNLTCPEQPRIALRAVIRTAHAAFKVAFEIGPQLLVLQILLSGVASVLAPAMARLGGAIIDAVTSRAAGGGSRTILALVALEAVLTIGAMVVSMACGEANARLRERLDLDMTGRGLRKALSQLDAPRTRDQLSRVMYVGYTVAGTIGNVVTLLASVLSLSGYLVAGRSLSCAWVLVFAGIAGVRFWLGVRAARHHHARERGRTSRLREGRYLQHLLSDATVAPEVKVLGIGPVLLNRWEQMMTAVYGERRLDAIRRAFFSGGTSIVETCTLSALYAYLAVFAGRGLLTIGELTFSMMAIRATKSSIQSVLASCQYLHDDHLRLVEVWEFLALKTEEPGGTAIDGPSPGDGLRLEHVTLTYPGASSPTLRDVSLHLVPGERVVLLGSNGSGKTTLLSVLCGLYAPTSGRVVLDGRDLTEWDRVALRRRLAVMFQTFGKYELTARENIALGDRTREAGTQQLDQAASLGLADHVVGGLPHRYESRLGREFSGACQLSGGQWQRVALSRLFFRTDADLLVLDEPTAAMDIQAEARAVDSLAALPSSRMLVVASHRQEVMRLATRVIVLDQGRVVEDDAPRAIASRGEHGARPPQPGTAAMEAA
jgi:ATP-binding cassette, subfamily B, bacterial